MKILKSIILLLIISNSILGQYSKLVDLEHTFNNYTLDEKFISSLDLTYIGLINGYQTYFKELTHPIKYMNLYFETIFIAVDKLGVISSIVIHKKNSGFNHFDLSSAEMLKTTEYCLDYFGKRGFNETSKNPDSISMSWYGDKYKFDLTIEFYDQKAEECIMIMVSRNNF